MLLFAAAALAASSPQQVLSKPTPAMVQARATVRIVSGARLSWDEQADRGQPVARTSVIRTAEGEQLARLIEFE